jgi:erythronate-4-phosphate dehydrogenase
MRLVCDENIVGLEALADRCELVTAAGRAIGAQLLRDADALWVRSVTRVDATLLAGSSLRFVGTATAGVEHIDRAVLAQRHIPFAAAPGANANAVVEYVLAALAELAEPWRRLDQGGRLGIVGYGHVGRLLARVATGLGWRVRVSDPWVEAGGEAVPGTAALADILDCDVISLHCSLHDRAPWPSRHLIDGPALARLRGEQWLINAARGAVVDNAALLLRCAAPSPPQLVLDVWEGEPEFDLRLLAYPALRLATPHIAGYSWDAKWQATQMLRRATEKAGLLPPQPEPGAPAADALRLPADADTQALAAALLAQRYRVSDDDRAFREMARSVPASARGNGFDALRRDYRKRRELRGSALLPGDAMRALEEPARRLLQALGVRGS